MRTGVSSSEGTRTPRMFGSCIFVVYTGTFKSALCFVRIIIFSAQGSTYQPYSRLVIRNCQDGCCGVKLKWTSRFWYVRPATFQFSRWPDFISRLSRLVLQDGQRPSSVNNDASVARIDPRKSKWISYPVHSFINVALVINFYYYYHRNF